MSASVRSAAAALLLAVPVTAEAVHLVEDDQRVVASLFALTQLAGWALVGTVVRDLAVAAPGGGRWGPRLVTAGVALQLLFALAWLTTLLVLGEAAEATFIAFALGFLCLTVGGPVWARRLRRTPYRGAAAGLVAVAVLGFAAIAVGDTPLHDVALVGSYLAWVLVGGSVTATGDRADRPRVSASSR